MSTSYDFSNVTNIQSMKAVLQLLDKLTPAFLSDPDTLVDVAYVEALAKFKIDQFASTEGVYPGDLDSPSYLPD